MHHDEVTDNNPRVTNTRTLTHVTSITHRTKLPLAVDELANEIKSEKGCAPVCAQRESR